MTNIQAVLCLQVGLHIHALNKYAPSKNLLLLQSLVYVLIYQENKATIAEIGQSFLRFVTWLPSYDIVEMIIVYDCFSK